MAGAFVAGLLAGEALVVVGYIVATNWFGLADFDGGGAMGAIFVLGPLVGIFFGAAAAAWLAFRPASR